MNIHMTLESFALRFKARYGGLHYGNVFSTLTYPITLAEARWRIIPFGAHNDPGYERSGYYRVALVAPIYVIKLVSVSLFE